ncbi:tetratricopeptide repeat protein [Steroidobacter cummioxidans]|uniref:tetratricopeptide repeat protein n=1 Tax=Steroidobacter cummioxidans TaxID=1803913 RepID=UPI000E30DB3F|nr:tetratricopeptide repeat protein [Steroidobacter cummioxidans]
MTLSVEELVAKAKDQLRRGRHDEAQISAREATRQDANEPNAWWMLGRACLGLKDHAGAARAFGKVTELAPDYADAWALYGNALYEVGRRDEAEEPLRNAFRLGTENGLALFNLAEWCEEQKDEEGEYGALARLEELGNLDHHSLVLRLGTAHWRHDRPHDALRCYRKCARKKEEASSLFNMGLVYNDPEISQDVDAIDAWRLCEHRYPAEPAAAKASKKIAEVLPRLLKLRTELRAGADSVLDAEAWFSTYLNPFELLNIRETNYTFDMLDAKVLQRLKKQLMSEIELEEGKLGWMADHVVDRSRALAVCEELNDDTKRKAHWLVFNEKPLLDFLSRGSHAFFTAAPTRSPIDLLETMDSDEDTFLPWLSSMFARQYNAVLNKAFETRNLTLLEVLFDGRRWVLPEHEDQCFEAGRRHVEQLLEPFRDAASEAEKTKPDLAKVEALTKLPAVAILNLLPHPFRDLQNAAVKSLRDMSLAAHNQHDDTLLATSILELTRAFHFKSTALNHQLEEDYSKLQDMLREQKKHEAHLTSGKSEWKITREFVQQGDRNLPVTQIQALRWGALNDNGIVEFTVGFMDLNAEELLFSWKTATDIEANRTHFGKLLDAAISYVVPHVLERIDKQLKANKPLFVGACKLTKAGIEFERAGWFTNKRVHVPWTQIESKVVNGNVLVWDKLTPKNQIAFDMRLTQNAVLLPLLARDPE